MLHGSRVTITVDADTLKRARIRAIERGESVNAFLASELRRYADADDAIARQREATAKLIDVARSIGGRSAGRRFSREDLYAERIDRYRAR
ncbi:hypothetical protein [Ruania alba]|uniref:Toxin-antitoxin system HicB family antitoxin n=1 Tax=Ruania alba TaxID=648782 RepID=A0A1H5N0F8_9MICO|nr:hypothetical protein [Ruania alba]SEE94930.1 hypothetical protein SAMN04488554_3804 [Ruania alba]